MHGRMKEHASAFAVSDRERVRIVKLQSEGHSGANIARILGRSRKCIWQIRKQIAATAKRGRRGPGSRKRREPRAVMRWWPSPGELFSSRGERIIADALGD